MQRRGQVSSFVISLVINAATLLVLHLFFHLSPETIDELLAIESIKEPQERKRADFEKKLDTQIKPATSFNLTAGAVSSTIGGRSTSIKARVKIQPKNVKQLRNVAFSPSDVNVPSPDMLGEDLGESEVNGDAQVLVKGYGPALDLLTQELIRMMRTDKLLVVWLFDESGSMKDDQQEIKKRLGRVFTELKIVDREPERIGIAKKIRRKIGRKKSLLSEIMVSSVVGFGKQYHAMTKKPTSDIGKILAAIDKIPVDESGKEYMCFALTEAIKRHRVMKIKSKRKLVLIVISDESGDDGAAIENVINQVKKLKAPIYILGRESVFGSLYAHVNWTQPETGRVFYLPIRRGPETPFAELMQYDGFRRRYDSHMSGFGAYEQVRLCRNSGGIFFQLPHEQADLNEFDNRKYASYALREYLPDLSKRVQYVYERNSSSFRKAIWNVIVMLNPYNKANKGLELPNPRYQNFSTDPSQYGPMTARRGRQILTLIAVMGRAIRHLENVRSLRAREPSRRWRANYDLILAQLYWYQLRLFEYGIGMDQFVRKGIPASLAVPRKNRHNRWYIRETSRKLVLPDKRNQKAFKITPDQLKEMHKTALARLADVGERHPNTPWASRAHWEMKRPFGVDFRTYYSPPPKKSRGSGRSKPRPKPTPPPKL